MSSSRLPGRLARAAIAASLCWAPAARAQQGFAVERFYPSAPGGGWFVMDDLSMRGGLGGVAALTGGYALAPLRVTAGTQSLAVVSDQAFANIGLGVTLDRFRLYLDLTSPLAIEGKSGTVGSYQFTAPSVDVANPPDLVSDARVGFDARILGDPKGPFRLGAGAQLLIPNGNRSDYDTDGTVRTMLRLLFAGDVGHFTYAAQLGVHVRPLDDSPTPGSPAGSELLFGAAAGASIPLDQGGRTVLVVGPEVYGETAFRTFFGGETTGVEALMTGRVEGTGDDGPQLRVKLGTGGGLAPSFGAPEWRIVFGVELFDRHAAAGAAKTDGTPQR